MIKSFIDQWINNWYHYFPVRYIVGIETKTYVTNLYIEFKRIKSHFDAEVFAELVKQTVEKENNNTPIEFDITYILKC